MNIVEIKIQALEDAGLTRMNSHTPEISHKDVSRGQKLTVAILEDMTASHKSGVDLVIAMPDGKHIAYMITEENFKAICTAFHNSLQMFAERQAQRGFDPFKNLPGLNGQKPDANG